MRKRKVVDLRQPPRPRRKRRTLKPRKSVMKVLSPILQKAARVAAKNNHHLSEWVPGPEIGNVMKAHCLKCGSWIYASREPSPKDEMSIYGPCNWGMCNGTP